MSICCISGCLTTTIVLFSHRARSSVKCGLIERLKITKLGMETEIAFYNICITCHEEEKLQLVFVAEVACRRVQVKLICIQACG